MPVHFVLLLRDGGKLLFSSLLVFVAHVLFSLRYGAAAAALAAL
ncbi:ORF10 [Psittacine aviadenovirus B]|uniref:ORF10 n=1 Tax=psittacine adenovirus 4 TaxID=2773287 RepID=A0A1P8SW65_9ADEN|nr:ORF10 [Psittacine aviadenovirus B]APY28350.1 ORF10 [psittacine adenovirus 4]